MKLGDIRRFVLGIISTAAIRRPATGRLFASLLSLIFTMGLAKTGIGNMLHSGKRRQGKPARATSFAK